MKIRTDRALQTLVLLTLFTMLAGAACNKAADPPGNTKPTPANVAVAVAVNPTTRHT